MIALPVKNSSTPYIVQPSKIIAMGLNYRDHIAENAAANIRGFTDDIPSEPIIFSKTTNVLIGPEEPIVIPKFLKSYAFKNQRTDYEAELALIIGRMCKDVTPDAAIDYILGYTCMNDVSQRNFQNHDQSGWFRGKSLDTFGPIGPCLVLARDIPSPQNLEIRCRLNGKTVQSANTCQMIFSIPEIVAFISKHITLVPGDIVITGTPAGVGALHHGDVVEVEVEQIGVLRNPVIDESV